MPRFSNKSSESWWKNMSPREKARLLMYEIAGWRAGMGLPPIGEIGREVERNNQDLLRKGKEAGRV